MPSTLAQTRSTSCCTRCPPTPPVVRTCWDVCVSPHPCAILIVKTPGIFILCLPLSLVIHILCGCLQSGGSPCTSLTYTTARVVRRSSPPKDAGWAMAMRPDLCPSPTSLCAHGADPSTPTPPPPQQTNDYSAHRAPSALGLDGVGAPRLEQAPAASLDPSIEPSSISAGGKVA